MCISGSRMYLRLMENRSLRNLNSRLPSSFVQNVFLEVKSLIAIEDEWAEVQLVSLYRNIRCWNGCLLSNGIPSTHVSLRIDHSRCVSQHRSEARSLTLPLFFWGNIFIWLSWPLGVSFPARLFGVELEVLDPTLLFS